MVPKGVFPVPGRGGVDNVAYLVAWHLADLGHKVHLVVDVSEGFEGQPNLIVHRLNVPSLPTSNINWWAATQTLAAVYAFRVSRAAIGGVAEPFDIIHTHGPLAGFLLSLTNPEIANIHTVHDPTPYMCRYESSYERFLRKVHFHLVDLPTYKRVDRVITVGSGIKTELARWGVSSDRMAIISNGVDIELFHCNPKASFGVPYDEFCLFVGSLTPRKGVQYLLEAIEDVDDVNCVIVGDGREKEGLQSKVRALGLAKRVHFTGALPQEDISRLYSAAEFLIVPSLAEGLPLVIIEAMACGLPVIATRISGVTDIVRDRQNGLLVEPGNVEELRESIAALRQRADLRDAMASNAQRTISEDYSWSAIARRTAKEYVRAIGRH